MSNVAVMGVDYEDEERPVETYQGLYVYVPNVIASHEPVRFRSGQGVYEDEIALIRFLHPRREIEVVTCSSTVDTFMGAGGRLVCVVG
jgi:hypothetical protein